MRAGTKLAGGALAAGASLALVAWIAGGGGSGSGPVRAAPAVAQAPAPARPAAPVAAPVAAPAQPAPPAAPAAPAATPSPAEDAQIASVRAEVDVHPAIAVQLAEEGDRRFPDGRHAPERAYLKMRALVHLDDIVAARDAATAFFERHPNDPFGEYVWRLTGVRPRPSPFARR
jgi:hypothetical protein